MTLENRYVSAEDRGDVLILSLALARIADFEVAEAIGRALVSAAVERPSPKVVVNLSQLQYMSSVGYGPFISLRHRVLEAGGRLVLCGLSPVIRQLFETTRLLINPNSPGSLFAFTDTIDAAVELMSEKG